MADLLEAAEYIRREQPAAAKRLYGEIQRQTKLLRTHPMLGRVVPEFENRFLRELILRPYRVIYRWLPREGRIEILAVVHSARLLPKA
jgi:toxin ParE1/3/4